MRGVGKGPYSSLRQVPLRLKLVASVLALVGAALLVISTGSALALHSYLIDKIDTEHRR
jgi:two-component system OmpR family sensor kinase